MIIDYWLGAKWNFVVMARQCQIERNKSQHVVDLYRCSDK